MRRQVRHQHPMIFSSWALTVVVAALLAAKDVTALSTSSSKLSLSRSTHPFHTLSSRSNTLLNAVPGADIEQETEDNAQPQVVGDNIIYRGKVNEIDYCIAPADVSLSRAYGKDVNKDSTSSDTITMSLTQALNNASNRAVRRILLAKCWPSEEALNRSLRLAAAAEKQAEEERRKAGSTTTAKCPVPRPILNLLMRKGGEVTDNDTSSESQSKQPPQRNNNRTMQQYVEDQIQAFRDRYGSLAGYSYAEAYLESILSLATTGKESNRVQEVLESKVYDESYRRVISVLKSVGVVLDAMPDSERFQIAAKLNDLNFCWSMMDMLAMKNENSGVVKEVSDEFQGKDKVEEETEKVEKEAATSGKKGPLRFLQRNNGAVKPSYDGQVILCGDEPSMTRQLNGFSNIVHRGLLYGGDQELLVLSETLADNRDTFVERWYPDTGPFTESMQDETRPGVQYLNALISLLRKAYDEGAVTNLEPMVPLNTSYGNSYERLMASLVELGSGYVRPDATDVMAMPKPRTAQEELGRFAVWESTFRTRNDDGESAYPQDLEGTWVVKDEVGGETIGESTVTLAPQGEVVVEPPLQGLRWRLDPGPTHLDTCTFQVLSEDGTILQYRGFLDRGARLEARFSKRPTRIRGSVMFQMRYGGANYWKDMLPVNYKTGATKFEMTKQGNER